MLVIYIQCKEKRDCRMIADVHKLAFDVVVKHSISPQFRIMTDGQKYARS